jgi:hypothetical protein
MPLLINGFTYPHFGTRFHFKLTSYFYFPRIDLDIIIKMPIIFLTLWTSSWNFAVRGGGNQVV